MFSDITVVPEGRACVAKSQQPCNLSTYLPKRILPSSQRIPWLERWTLGTIAHFFQMGIGIALQRMVRGQEAPKNPDSSLFVFHNLYA
jgi:hypothetical protein